MSPEQAQGPKVDARSDVYALGIVIYEIFTGHVPFRGETPISTILKHLNDPPPLDGPLAARIPAELKTVLRRCLAKDPADRYASAREVGEALREAQHPSRRQQPMTTEVLRAPTLPSTTAPTVIAPRRRGLQPWLLAVPVVAGAGLVLMVRGRAPDTAARPEPPPTTLAAAPPATLPATLPAAPPSPVSATPAPSAVPPSPTPRPRPSPSPRAVVVPPAPPPSLAIAPPVTAPPVTAAPAPVGNGLLQVVVKPWGEVVVDGRAIGTTPLDRVSLAAGVHALEVRHPLYEPWEARVTVRPGQTERVVVDFPAQGRRKQP